ncbi:pyridoxal-phosphate dependent enzyme [Amycolatopsis sp. cmx-11-12]|uniref:pyridoxal-phosphate dependent enzyme n=1 Tax=Amycolatopsis sp. cmx-11-12 TaxID=2785795 RepID=UPI003916D422
MSPVVTAARRSPGVVESSVLPKIVGLGGNLHAAVFQLMKLLPAQFILQQATASGELDAGTTVIETTSGTFGLGLAIVCRLRGNPLILVGDPAIDAALRRRLTDLGVQVHIVAGRQLAKNGVQQARLDRLARIQRRHEKFYTPRQYDNPLNAASYRPVADLITERLGRVDVLVCPVGSGGSSSGIASVLRERFPDLRLVGVDTPGSVLFGAPVGPRPLRGLGSGIVPQVLEHSLFDEVHWVGAAEAFASTRGLYADHCLYMGPSSGAAHLVAAAVARRRPDAVTLVVMPDEGHRYQRTVHDPRWLRRQDLFTSVVPHRPVDVDHPTEVVGGWSRFAWNRRTREQVVT